MNTQQIINLYKWAAKAWDKGWINRMEWHDETELAASIESWIEQPNDGEIISGYESNRK